MQKKMLLWLWCIMLGVCQSVEAESVLIKTLSSEWLHYDNSLQAYVPFLPSFQRQVRTLHLPLAIDSKRSAYFLQLESEKGDWVFVNNKLFFTFSKKSKECWALQDLKNQFVGDTLLISLYRPMSNEAFKQLPAIYILQNCSDLSESKKNENIQQQIQQKERAIIRPEMQQQDWLTIYAFLLLGLSLLLSHVMSPLISRQAFADIWDFFFKPQYVLKRTGTLLFVSYALFYALSMGFIVLLLGTYIDLFADDYIVLPLRTTFLRVLLDWLALSLVFLVTVVLRYLIIQFLSYLFFDRESVSDVHLQAHVYSGILIANIVLVGSLLLSTKIEFLPPSHRLFYFYVLIGLIVLRSLFIVYHVHKSIAFRKFYLFLYLCASEYIPLFFAAEIIAAL
ncbi:MAG: DUF4271 domain-containing protein [Bernardetiaceae bacterium]|nr:DUF4271 domain-containing protein [Bernardetiaceae bacterium]